MQRSDWLNRASRNRLRRVVDVFTYPLKVEDFLGLVDPLASSKQLRGVVTRVEPETPTSVTITFRPGRGWTGHDAGQWVRIGVEIDGVRHWRSYSLSSAADGEPQVTVTSIGRVSEHLVTRTRVGDVWYLDLAQGEFTLPTGPRPLLMITAGSGITPVMSMLRTLVGRRHDADVVVLHSARTRDESLFTDELEGLAARHPGLCVVHRFTHDEGRLDLSDAAELNRLVPDWRRRAAYVCGPAGLLDDAQALWATSGADDALTVERFTPPVADDAAAQGGTASFTTSGKDVDTDGTRPLLEVAEDAGILMRSGCRMGICRTCLTPLAAGRVRDLTTGEVHGDEGELIRTCVSAAAGDVRLIC